MPDPKTQQIWDAIRDLLTTSKTSGTLTYIKNIYEGMRVPPAGAFPLIIMEPDSTDEEDFTVSSPRGIRIIDRILLHIGVEDLELGRGIIGDATYKGIKDVVADVKNVIAADARLSLSSFVHKVSFPNTRYFLDNFPIREAVITVEVTGAYRSNER